MNLSDLPLGQSGYISDIPADTRLAALGMIPGTEITPMLSAPCGTPRAYLFRGVLLALRREEAQGIALESPDIKGADASCTP